MFTTIEGHRIPLDFENGLPHIKMQYPSEEDMKLPHVIMTKDKPWNPSKYDKKLSSEVRDFDPVDSIPYDALHPNFNQLGELIKARYWEMSPPEEWGATVDLLLVSMSYQHCIDSTSLCP